MPYQELTEHWAWHGLVHWRNDADQVKHRSTLSREDNDGQQSNERPYASHKPAATVVSAHRLATPSHFFLSSVHPMGDYTHFPRESPCSFRLFGNERLWAA